MRSGGGGLLDVEVPAALAGERVDKAVALLADLPRSAVTDLVDAGAVLLDGEVVTTRSRILAAGQRLQAAIPAIVADEPRPDREVVFEVVYEDDDLIVVDKPAGLVVHHGAGHRGGTLVDGLLHRYPELADLPGAGAGEPARPGIVHRLDKGTSGLLVVARSPAAFQSLSAQLREHTAGRFYQTLVIGSVESDAGVVDAPIGRSSRLPTRMTISHQGRPARTNYRVLDRFNLPEELTLLEASLETGRTHQVRVHLAAIGHPVVGDDRDRGAVNRPLAGALPNGRLFLHAFRLTLDHPRGDRLTWESPLPADLQGVLARLS